MSDDERYGCGGCGLLTDHLHSDEECIEGLRATLAEKDAEIARLTRELKTAREEERARLASLFEGLNWLCLDHGGEEAERIVAIIRGDRERP